MLRVGLTGGVACGKSTIGGMLVARGARLIRADDISHRLMSPGQPVYEEVVRRFGSSVVNSDGSINRPKLAEAAFGGGRVEELNRIVHPAVIDFQNRWMDEEGKRDPNGVIIVEAALILEAGAKGRFDKLIVVTARPDQKIERFAARQHLSYEDAKVEVERRSRAQLPDEDKVRAADYIIDNSADLASAERQVDALWPELKRLAQAQAARG
jgi:dephospho-CoA kinase